jgi:hypothetical protein
MSGPLWGPPQNVSTFDQELSFPDPLPPPPAPVGPAPAAAPRRRGPTWIVIPSVFVVLLVAVLVVAVLQLHGRATSQPVPAAQQPVVTAQSTFDPPTVTDPPNETESGSAPSFTPSSVPSSVPPTAEPGVAPDGYRRVSGPGGVEVSIPIDWTAHPGPSQANYQADAPDGSGRFVRFGGAAAPDGDLVATLDEYARTNPNIQSGYRQLRLETVAYGTATQAADWEFLYLKDGVQRHAYGRYWIVSGVEYVAYLSTPAAGWTDSEQMLDVLITTATPV